ncbi:MAG: SEC-C metal-binding domain-containing protein, partial [Propionibacterium sp.]|nr:SEC-C metal-binding domain-containing protein [Propionibacterium sp.]
AELGEDTMRELERQVLLTVLDRKWREHLYEMDYLREGIGLRAMAQRDPLVEYQREGGQMFTAMMEAFMEEVVGYLFNLEVQVGPQVAPVMTAEGTPVDIDELLADMGRGRVPSATPSAALAPAPGARPEIHARGLEEHAVTGLAYSAPDEQGAAETRREQEGIATAAKASFSGVGRNQKCPCGSGKKFKNCHGAAA